MNGFVDCKNIKKDWVDIIKYPETYPVDFLVDDFGCFRDFIDTFCICLFLLLFGEE